MGGFLIFGYFISIAISIIVWILICKKFYNIACDKGHDSTWYFILPFFFGIIGFLIVAALPDRGDYRIDQLKKEIQELKHQLSKSQSKNETEPVIPEKVTEDGPATVSVANTDDGDFWTCGKCGKRNMKSNSKCWNCDNDR